MTTRETGNRSLSRPALGVRATYLLGLAATISFALAVHPATSPGPIAGLLDLPIQPDDVVGPRCPLAAWSPASSQDGLWQLPPYRQVIPYELLLAGYPDTPQRAHDLIVQVTCTAYSSTYDQTDSTPFITASMQPVGRGIIALSRDLLRRYTPGAPFAFGDRVEVVGVGEFRVEDTMHRRWSRRADIWVSSRREARQWGRQQVLIGAIRPARQAVIELRATWSEAGVLAVELLESPPRLPAAGQPSTG